MSQTAPDERFTSGHVGAGSEAALLLTPWSIRDVTAPIPEPETYAMMLAGLGLLRLVRRRTKKAVA